MEHTNPFPGVNTRVYFDITIDDKPADDQLVFELYATLPPIACNNFISLCKGTSMNGTDGNALSYKGCELTPLEGTVPGLTGGVSGAKILHQQEIRPLPCEKGSLCLLLSADLKSVDGSRFVIYVTPPEAEEELFSSLLIGKVVRGMDILSTMASLSGDPKKIVVSDCGLDRFYEVIHDQHQRILKEYNILTKMLEQQTRMDKLQAENYNSKQQIQAISKTLTAEMNSDSGKELAAEGANDKEDLRHHTFYIPPIIEEEDSGHQTNELHEGAQGEDEEVEVEEEDSGHQTNELHEAAQEEDEEVEVEVEVEVEDEVVEAEEEEEYEVLEALEEEEEEVEDEGQQINELVEGTKTEEVVDWGHQTNRLPEEGAMLGYYQHHPVEMDYYQHQPVGMNYYLPGPYTNYCQPRPQFMHSGIGGYAVSRSMYPTSSVMHPPMYNIAYPSYPAPSVPPMYDIAYPSYPAPPVDVGSKRNLEDHDSGWKKRSKP